MSLARVVWLIRFDRALDAVCDWLAWRLPKRIVYFAVIRAWAFATTGKHGNTVAPGVSCSDVVQRWGRR